MLSAVSRSRAVQCHALKSCQLGCCSFQGGCTARGLVLADGRQVIAERMLIAFLHIVPHSNRQHQASPGACAQCAAPDVCQCSRQRVLPAEHEVAQQQRHAAALALVAVHQHCAAATQRSVDPGLHLHTHIAPPPQRSNNRQRGRAGVAGLVGEVVSCILHERMLRMAASPHTKTLQRIMCLSLNRRSETHCN